MPLRLDAVDCRNLLKSFLGAELGLSLSKRSVLQLLQVKKVLPKQLGHSSAVLDGLDRLFLIFVAGGEQLLAQCKGSLLWRLNALRYALRGSEKLLSLLVGLACLQRLGQILHVDQATLLVFKVDVNHLDAHNSLLDNAPALVVSRFDFDSELFCSVLIFKWVFFVAIDFAFPILHALLLRDDDLLEALSVPRMNLRGTLGSSINLITVR